MYTRRDFGRIAAGSFVAAGVAQTRLHDPIVAVIEYEYMGEASAIDEVNTCVRYMRTALA